jgi:hypothetical protein
VKVKVRLVFTTLGTIVNVVEVTLRLTVCATVPVLPMKLLSPL